MTMITPSYLGETIEYSSLHACRSTLEDPTRKQPRNTSIPINWIWTDCPSIASRGWISASCPTTVIDGLSPRIHRDVGRLAAPTGDGGDSASESG